MNVVVEFDHSKKIVLFCCHPNNPNFDFISFFNFFMVISHLNPSEHRNSKCDVNAVAEFGHSNKIVFVFADTSISYAIS